MIFNFERTVSINNVNIRKENHGEDRELAIDVSVHSVGVPAELIAPLFQVSPETLARTLWQTNDRKSPILDSLGSIPVGVKFADTRHVCCFEDGNDYREKPHIIDKFKIELQDDARCDLTFRMAFQKPTKEFVDSVMELLKEETFLSLTSEGDLFEGGAKPEAEEEAEQATANSNTSELTDEEEAARATQILEAWGENGAQDAEQDQSSDAPEAA